MYNRNKILAITIILCLPLGLLFVPMPTSAQFVLASSYPTEYGEGIFSILVSENTTGDWLDLGYSAPEGNFKIGNKVLNWSDWANQGVTQDGTYVYTTNATHIMKYTKAGAFIAVHDATSDSGLGAGWGMGGPCYYSNYLYISAHTADASNSSILKYNTLLTFITEYDTPEPIVEDNLAAGGISFHDGYFWVGSDSNTDHTDFQMTKYDTSFNLVEIFAVDGFDIINDWHYQGIDWYEDYILCNIHEGSSPQVIDVYKFTGSEFVQMGRIEQPLYFSEGTTNWLSQGISIENDAGTYYIWFASRKVTTAENEVAKYRLLVDSPSSNTFNIAVDTDIKLDARIAVNFTRLGLSYPFDVDLCKNYMRLNATITVAGTVVFSQDNFTYSTHGLYDEESVIWYSYTLILHDVFVSLGTIYLMTVTYEIYGWS